MITSIGQSRPRFSLPLSRIKGFIDTALIALCAGSVGFALGGAHTQTAIQPLPAADRLQPIEISRGPLLDTLSSPEFLEFQRQWAQAEASKDREAARAELSNANAAASQTIERANKKATQIEIEANYAIADFRSHAPEGNGLFLQYAAAVKSSTETQTGCDLTIEGLNGEGPSLITNLKKGSCASVGKYSSGSQVAQYGKNPAGIKNLQ